MNTFWRNLMLFIMLVLLSMTFFACDDGTDADDDDDNNDDNNDDNHNDNNAGWPNNVKPIVGWFATQKGYYDQSWGGLYYFDGSSVKEMDTVGENAFEFGSLPNGSIGWADNGRTLFQVDDSGWSIFPLQPDCSEDQGVYHRDAVLFPDSTGMLTCEWQGPIWRWDAGSWTSLVIPNWESSHGPSIECASKSACLVWNPTDLRLFNGTDFTTLPDPGDLTTQSSPALLPNGDVYILEYMTEYESPYRLLRYHNGTWGLDEHFSETENWLFFPIMRLLADSIALSYDPGGDEEERTVVLADDNEVIDTGWPRFNAMAFAPGGGGLAIDSDDRVVYWLNGLEMTPIYELAEDEVPSGFLVAADME